MGFILHMVYFLHKVLSSMDRWFFGTSLEQLFVCK